jgi:hypothetical protein
MKRGKKSSAKRTGPRPRGRPRTGIGTQIGVRWSDDELAALDRWRRQQPDQPARPEALRRLVRLTLKIPPVR